MAGSRKKRGKSDTAKAQPSRAERFPVDKRLPPEKLLPITKPPFANVAKTDLFSVEQAKINEIVNLLWLPKVLSEEDKNARIVKAIDLFESIKPADGIEAMLAAQMVGAHEAAMDCLRRAMIEGQTFEGRNVNLGHAQRLMGLYARQLAALDKHRGKGQQKVTVEHVHVAPGAQAIVGNVEAGAGAASGSRKRASPALDAPGEPLPSPLEESKAGRERKP